MDLIIAAILFVSALAVSIIFKISILALLGFGLLLLIGVSLRRGFPFKEVMKMIYRGAKKSAVVMVLYILISLLTAAWRASGTIPFLVYWGIKLIAPEAFLLFAFLIPTVFSFLVGSSFGACGTIGVAMLILARANGISLPLAAGAIFSGAYFGDRASPFAGASNYIASLTGTNIYDNVKRLLKGSIVPLALASALYVVSSLLVPMNASQATVFSDIEAHFNLNFIVIAPTLVIIVLALFRCNVKVAMAVSTAVAVAIAIFLQGETPLAMLRYMILGYTPRSVEGFGAVISGGGAASMVQTWLIVILSCTYAGIFEGTKMLSGLDKMMYKFAKRTTPFTACEVTGLVTAAFACNQTLATTLTMQLMKEPFERLGKDKHELAVCLSDSVVFAAPVLPWNIAATTALAMMGWNTSAIPFAYFLFLTPLWHLVVSWVEKRREKRKPAVPAAPESVARSA